LSARNNQKLKQTKVGFVLLSNSKAPIPSTRIAALNMFPFLREAGFEPHIIFEPRTGTETPDVTNLAPRLIAEEFRIVFFQKVHGPSVLRLAHELYNAGIKTVFGVCDLVNVAMAEATDATVVVTDYLKSLYPIGFQSKIHTVHDGIERPDMYKNSRTTHVGSVSRPLRAVIVTSSQLDHLPVLKAPPKWLEVNIVGRYTPWSRPFDRVREYRWTLANLKSPTERLEYLGFLANRRIKCVTWDPLSVYKAMCDADIGIIPVDTARMTNVGVPAWKVKSENRLTMKMSIGLPTIATPIPSYEVVIDQGRNGFLARSPREWLNYLDALRDPGTRQAIGETARQSVLQRYSMEEQARRLIEVFHNLLATVDQRRTGVRKTL
jgi:glycosyltransferase involved in cell wall biosynthesis